MEHDPVAEVQKDMANARKAVGRATEVLARVDEVLDAKERAWEAEDDSADDLPDDDSLGEDVREAVQDLQSAAEIVADAATKARRWGNEALEGVRCDVPPEETSSFADIVREMMETILGSGVPSA